MLFRQVNHIVLNKEAKKLYFKTFNVIKSKNLLNCFESFISQIHASLSSLTTGSSSLSKIGTIKFSLDIKLYLVINRVNRLQR